MNRYTTIEILNSGIINTRDYPKNIKVVKSEPYSDCLFCFTNTNGLADSFRYAIDSSIYAEYVGKGTPKIPLGLENLKSIYKVLGKFTNKKRWDEFSDSPFQYKYIKGYVKQMRANIRWLIKYFKSHKNEIVIFSDTYIGNKNSEAKNEKEN